MESDDSAEGAVCRNLFRTSSCSSCSSSDDDRLNGGARDGDVEEEEMKEFSLSTVMDVRIQTSCSRASIAQQLWPAAEHLARFIAKIADHGSDKNSNEEPSGNEVVHEKKILLASLKSLLTESVSERNPLFVIELGAGVGLTGLELATQFPCRVLLTDMEEALPLLETNVKLNREKFVCGPEAVACARLAWGTDDWRSALEQFGTGDQECLNRPLLIIAADCVYFEELHLPLEQTLMHLLSSSPHGSLCIISGARRWKRDNAFYAKLGRNTKSETHSLSCTCIDEMVTRTQQGRDILRVYGVQWISRKEAWSTKT